MTKPIPSRIHALLTPPTPYLLRAKLFFPLSFRARGKTREKKWIGRKGGFPRLWIRSGVGPHPFQPLSNAKGGKDPNLEWKRGRVRGERWRCGIGPESWGGNSDWKPFKALSSPLSLSLPLSPFTAFLLCPFLPFPLCPNPLPFLDPDSLSSSPMPLPSPLSPSSIPIPDFLSPLPSPLRATAI